MPTTTETDIITQLSKSPGATRDAAIAADVTYMQVNASVAAAGSTLTDAAQLLPGVTVVSAADGTKGVKLPATPVAGTVVIVKGTAAAVLKVWPDAAATINAIGANGALSMTTGAMPSFFIASSLTQWYTIPLVAS